MNPKYERRDQEPLYEYGLRLIETKVEQKPDDLDWQDIIEATGMDCHRDSLRKAATVTPYSGYAVMQYFKKKGSIESDGHSDEYLKELDGKIVEMRKEAKRYQDQRREFRKLVDSAGRTEHLEDELVKAAQALNVAIPLAANKDPHYDSEQEAVLILADWHYGMVCENIWGKYNTDICKERVRKLVEEATEKIRLHGCRKLHILILGDMAHGAIHVSARVASNELVCEQIMNVSELLAQAISLLADSVDETYVYSTYGNHLRTIQNKSDSIHRDNMERLIPWWLEQRLSERGDVYFPPSEYYEFLYLDVCGYKICATHGDLDRLHSTGKTLNTLFSKRYGSQIDYVILADKHHQEEFEELGIESIICKSLCNADEYANGKRLYSTPGQLMMTFNTRVGRDASYQIKLG